VRATTICRPISWRFFLKEVARASQDGGVVYNAIAMLRENDFTSDEELEITRKRDRDTHSLNCTSGWRMMRCTTLAHGITAFRAKFRASRITSMG